MGVGRDFIARDLVVFERRLTSKERRLSRRKETKAGSVAFSQQGGAEHRSHQQPIAKTELVLKRESHGIVVQLAAVAQQPNPREPQKND
jgi:hypothetical protein